MGTDYYLADPEAKELVYIDRCGSDFACALLHPERRQVEGWPPGTANVINQESFAELASDPEAHRGTASALAWCEGRRTVLLIADQSAEDERNHDFCFEVLHRSYLVDPDRAGWKGADLC